MDVDLADVVAVHVRVLLDRADELGDARRAVVELRTRLRASRLATTQASAAGERRAGGGDGAVQPGRVHARVDERAGQRVAVEAARLELSPARPRGRSASSTSSGTALFAPSIASRCSRTSSAACSRSTPEFTKESTARCRVSNVDSSSRALRRAAAAGLLSSCASPAASWPSAARRSCMLAAPAARSKIGRIRRATRPHEHELAREQRLELGAAEGDGARRRDGPAHRARRVAGEQGRGARVARRLQTETTTPSRTNSMRPSSSSQKPLDRVDQPISVSPVASSTSRPVSASGRSVSSERPSKRSNWRRSSITGSRGSGARTARPSSPRRPRRRSA